MTRCGMAALLFVGAFASDADIDVSGVRWLRVQGVALDGGQGGGAPVHRVAEGSDYHQFCRELKADDADDCVVQVEQGMANLIAATFQDPYYKDINRRRQEHLASLRLPLANRSVLELGSGPGDHTPFFLERGCAVLVTDGRDVIVEALKSRYPHLPVAKIDLDRPPPRFFAADVVYSYGLLYHLENPGQGIDWMAAHTRSMLLLSTVVSFGAQSALRHTDEDAVILSQSMHGVASRPTRRWVFDRLRMAFSYVYMPVTQPSHPSFPLDWSRARISTSFVMDTANATMSTQEQGRADGRSVRVLPSGGNNNEHRARRIKVEGWLHADDDFDRLDDIEASICAPQGDDAAAPCQKAVGAAIFEILFGQTRRAVFVASHTPLDTGGGELLLENVIPETQQPFDAAGVQMKRGWVA